MTSRLSHSPAVVLFWVGVAASGPAFLALAFWLRFDAPIWSAF